MQIHSLGAFAPYLWNHNLLSSTAPEVLILPPKEDLYKRFGDTIGCLFHVDGGITPTSTRTEGHPAVYPLIIKMDMAMGPRSI
jgi:hypothetical protein